MTDARQPVAGAGETCPDFESLSCYADGELEDGADCRRWRRMSRRCGRCATLAARLREGFEADDARRDGGIGGSGCAGEELPGPLRQRRPARRRARALDAHLGELRRVRACRGAAAPPAGVAGRVSSAPVPAAVQRRADVGARGGAARARPPTARGRGAARAPAPGLFERLSELAARAGPGAGGGRGGALLAVASLPRGSQPPAGERSRAVAPASATLRVTRRRGAGARAGRACSRRSSAPSTRRPARGCRRRTRLVRGAPGGGSPGLGGAGGVRVSGGC